MVKNDDDCVKKSLEFGKYNFWKEDGMMIT